MDHRILSAPMSPDIRITPRWRLLLGLACLLAQVAVASASLWHHHHADEAPGQCSVCAAVLCSSTGDVPAPVLLAPHVPCIEFLAIAVEADGSTIPVRTAQARGPPVSNRA